MSGSKGLPGKFPEDKHTFIIDVEGNITKKRYVGEFSCVIPNVKMQCEIAKYRAFLNGDVVDFLDISTKLTHQMISHLKFTIEDAPKWWKESENGYNLRDANVIQTIYDSVLEFEQAWMKEIWGEELESSESVNEQGAEEQEPKEA